MGGIISPNFKQYYKAVVFKTVHNCNKDKASDQWNRIEYTETNPQVYGHLICNKGTKK